MTLRSVLARLWLPLFLAGACVAAWMLADRLGDQTVDTAAARSDTPSLGTPLISATRLRSATSGAQQAQRVETLSERWPAPTTALSCATVRVGDQVAFEDQIDVPLLAGPAQPLLTGYAALNRIDADYRFVTRVMAADPVDDQGRVLGNLYLIGGGDPVLMTRAARRELTEPLNQWTSLDDLAHSAVMRLGITEVGGEVVGVERRYDRVRRLQGWPQELAPRDELVAMSALTVRAAPGDTALGDGDGDGASDADPLDLGGALLDPAGSAADAFASLLRDRGATINGAVRGDLASEELPALELLVEATSPTLLTLVEQMWARDDRLAVELLLKELGTVAGGEGSTAAGAAIVSDELGDLGVELPVPLRDASGTDSIGSLTCRSLADVVAAIPADHPSLTALGDGSSVAPTQAVLGIVGGRRDNISAYVARSVDGGIPVTVATIINREDGITELDLAYQQRLFELIDEARLAYAVGE